MQFLTIRERKRGTERFARPMGPRGEFFAFEYEVHHDPAIEGVGIQLGPDVERCGSLEYWPDIRHGARVGWEEISHRDLRLCCTTLLIPGTREHPIDTSPHVVLRQLSAFVSCRLTEWALPIEFRADWLTSDVVALARGVHANGALDGLPALCDALIEAGCDDPLVIEHLQTCADHAPSCWVVEMILDQAAARG